MQGVGLSTGRVVWFRVRIVRLTLLTHSLTVQVLAHQFTSSPIAQPIIAWLANLWIEALRKLAGKSLIENNANTKQMDGMMLGANKCVIELETPHPAQDLEWRDVQTFRFPTSRKEAMKVPWAAASGCSGGHRPLLHYPCSTRCLLCSLSLQYCMLPHHSDTPHHRFPSKAGSWGPNLPIGASWSHRIHSGQRAQQYYHHSGGYGTRA